MTAETHTPGFECRAAFGLGVTSCADFVRAISAYKSVKAGGLAYINANTQRYSADAALVVFDGLRQLSRFSGAVHPTQTIVISEVVTLLKEITGIAPLDYTNVRSYEFNFIPIDFSQITRAVQRRSGTVTVGFINRDSLGFHIDVAAKADSFVSAFMSLMANLPFQHRQHMRTVLTAYFAAPTPDPAPVLALAARLESLALPSEVQRFVELFGTEHAKYHAAVNSDKSADWASKRYEVNAYTISYLRKMMRSTSITAEKVGRHDNVVATEER